MLIRKRHDPPHGAVRAGAGANAGVRDDARHRPGVRRAGGLVKRLSCLTQESVSAAVAHVQAGARVLLI